MVMGATSNIEWTDATWTPIRARRADGKLGVHCEKVSPACKNCYAERLNKRNLPAHGTGLDFTVLNRQQVEIIVDEEMITQPLRWKRGRRIFVCSQTDLFGAFVEEWQIAELFAVMALAHWHTFQVLTKRPERMQKLLSSDDFWESVEGGISLLLEEEVDPLDRRRNDLRATAPEPDPDTPLPNVWLGVTAENQEWASKRIPALVATSAAKRFVSCEPLLGPIDLSPKIDWVIAGGESGPGARPMHPDWVRDLRNQCQSSGVSFFFKQWGEWTPGENVADEKKYITATVDIENGEQHACSDDWATEADHGPILYRVGKKAAGSRLDGREWNEVPE
jgi:protein gp37